MKKLRFLVVFVFYAAIAKAQYSVSDFSLPANACVNQNIVIQNLSTNATTQEWDFCEGDLFKTPLLKKFDISDINIPYGASFVKAGNNWYAFICSTGSNSIFRIDFGSSLLNTPQKVTNLGSFGGLLDLPQDVKVVANNGEYFVFVNNNNLNSNNRLVAIKLGADIESLNGNALVLLNGSPFGNGGIDVFFDNQNWVVALTNYSTLTLVNVGGDLTSSLSPVNVVTTSGIPDVRAIGDVSFVRNEGKLYAFVVGFESQSLHRLNFDLAITPNPICNKLTTSTLGSLNPYGLAVAKDSSQWVIFLSTIQGNLERVVLGGDIENDVVSEVALGNLGGLANTLKVDVAFSESRWVAIANNWDSKSYYLLAFPQAHCGFDKVFSHDPNIPSIKSLTPGTEFVTLYATNDFGVTATESKGVVTSTDLAPEVSFSASSICVNTGSVFSVISDQSLNSYSWSFGDNSVSSLASPTHIYTAASTYLPSLIVTASNGCQNFVQNTLNVFNPPQPNFTLPNVSPFCTNQNYTYTNTSIYDNGSSPAWQWSVNGTNVASTQNLKYLFTTSSTKTVTLTSSIPGCATSFSQNTTSLIDGPLVSFTSPSTGCKGSPVSFTNATTDPITSYSWSFGDGNTSSQFNSSNIYTSTGFYTATLNATNTNGCQNSFSKDISIYSVPQPDFAIEAPPLSCERSPSQLDNLTPALIDSNISSWSWSFGDATNGSSTLKNPTYTYTSAGSYNVSLRATSNFGCTKSIQKSVIISPSPVANFTNSPACVNQGTRFTDASSGSVSFYQWSIQNNVLPGSTPSYTFRSSGTFPVTLTITSNNGCTNQITKNIIVPVLPVVDFTVQAPCTGHPSVLRETNPNTADPAVAWNWNFGQASGTGSPVSYQFASEGGYTVTMSTTRQSGCVYSTSENVNISTGPIARFTPSVFAGAAPLNVQFNNTSSADTYLWSFGDQPQSTSTAASPSFTYTTLGNYKALLTAKNNLGCSDTLSTEIYVVIPQVDLAMNSLTLNNDPTSNTSKPVITIFNAGNIPLIDPIVIFDLGGGASVKQKVSGMVRPGKSLSQMLGLQIVPSSIKYICAEIEAADDVNLYNNKQCVSLSHENVVMAPYPNPAISGHVTLEWIGASQENATVTIFKSNGEIVFDQHLDRVQAGLGQLDLSTSSLPNGLYLIRFVGSTITKTFRIVIAN